MDFKKITDKIYPWVKKGKILFFPLLFCYSELLLHLYAYRRVSGSMLWILAFALGIGFLFTFLTTVFPQRVNLVLTYVFTFLITLIYEIQLVYFAIFKGFAPVSSAKLGGQAITNFGGAALEGVRSALFMIVILLLPFILLCVFGIWKKITFPRLAKWYSAIPLGISAVILSGTVGVMALFFSGTPSLYGMFNSPDTSTDVSVGNFGLTVTMFQEIRMTLFPPVEEEVIEGFSEHDYGNEYQVDPAIDFNVLYDNAGNEELKNLTAALSNMPVSLKNEYTGLCEGYNLITICAEAYSPEFIDPELTPTLYKLTNSGFVFENFYSSFPNTTTNGEYAFCMGLWPDLSRGKTDSSFGVSASNYLPYTYGNIFKSKGWVAKAYHNYTAEYYHRDYTHKNMGYDFIAGNTGLDLEMTWPTSDYDMMVKSMDDYVDSDIPFTAYYMTFSGHYQYTVKDNAMSAKNWDLVKDLDYSDTVKAYIACNLELEKAMSYIMERLEKAGKADTTVIVLTTDHYPYGLTPEEYAELSGREINDVFDKQKNSFICYVPGIEPVRVDSYCSSIDILPTVLNLFGFDYDSRLLAGQDVLAENVDHVAILADGSFKTDGISYDASKVAFEYDSDSDELKKQGEKLFEGVKKKFRVSSQILNTDYYSYVFSQRSSGEEIVDPTLQYSDIEILIQASAYYVLSNDLMDPVSEDKFGLWQEIYTGEMYDVFYRIAGSPDIEADPAPFTGEDKYLKAATWAMQNGILREDGVMSYDLDSKVSVGQYALAIARACEYFGVEIEVDEDEVTEKMSQFPNMSEEQVRASLYCRDTAVFTDIGKPLYHFESATWALNRRTVVDSTYKLCTYVLEDYLSK